MNDYVRNTSEGMLAAWIDVYNSPVGNSFAIMRDRRGDPVVYESSLKARIWKEQLERNFPKMKFMMGDLKVSAQEEIETHVFVEVVAKDYKTLYKLANEFRVSVPVFWGDEAVKELSYFGNVTDIVSKEILTGDD